MPTAGWLNRAQGAGVPSGVVGTVGEAVRDRFGGGGSEGHAYGGTGGLAGRGGDLARLGEDHLHVTTSQPWCVMRFSGAAAGDAGTGRVYLDSAGAGEFRNGMPLVWSLGV